MKKIESITIEVHPSLDGGMARVTHKKNHKQIATARQLERYEYEYLMAELKQTMIPHLDLNKGKVWKVR